MNAGELDRRLRGLNARLRIDWEAGETTLLATVQDGAVYGQGESNDIEAAVAAAIEEFDRKRGEKGADHAL